MKKLAVLFLATILISCEKEQIQPQDQQTNNPTPQPQTIKLYPDATTPTIKIGDQIWTTKNLSVKTYRDGTPIIDARILMDSFQKGMWSWPNNDSAKFSHLGIMYNYAAVSNPKNIAPVGYHVPTLAEWVKMLNYLEPEYKNYPSNFGGNFPNSYRKAINYLKQSGYANWKKPELTSPDFSELVRTTATNSSGFTALPAGQNSRRINQPFIGPSTVVIGNEAISKWGYFLTADGYVIQMVYANGGMDMIQVTNLVRFLDKYDRFLSVRLIKD